MRLPATKIYRAMPELDRFTDQERAQIMSRATRRTDPRVMLAELGALIVWMLPITGAGALTLLSIRVMRDAPDGSRLHTAFVYFHRYMEQIEVAIVLLFVLATCVALLRVRDAGLRMAIRRHLKKTRCPGCRATLIGSPRTNNAVECESCGRVHQLRSLKLEVEDLGPALLPLTPNAVCPGCGYSIWKIPIEKRAVTCPECGVRTRVLVPEALTGASASSAGGRA